MTDSNQNSMATAQKNNEEKNVEIESKHVFFILVAVVALALIIPAGVSDLLNKAGLLDKSPNEYFKKDEILNGIKIAVTNGADLKTIKHIYETRKIKSYNTIEAWWYSVDEKYYLNTTTLSHVLLDLKVETYINKIDTSSNFLEKLTQLVIENDYLNPFDKLDSNQKYFFENIRKNLGGEYEKVAADLNKISDELANKNSLVKEYLSDATWSYRLSVAALVITLFPGIFAVLKFFRKKAPQDKTVPMDVHEGQTD